MSSNSVQSSWLLLALSMTLSAHAETPPDAGSLQQQIERQIPREPQGQRRPPLPLPVEMAVTEGLQVTVAAFRFSGNSLVSNERLTRATQPFVGKQLGLAGLQDAAAAVSSAYQQEGFLARTYIPRQEIVDGVVTLQIVEGVLGEVRFEGASSRLRDGIAAQYIERAQEPGKPVSPARLDRALLLLDDIPGVAANGSLAQGKGQGETDVIVNLAEEPLFGGEGGLDNSGSRFTGRTRATVNAYVNSPLRIGDLVQTNLAHSEGSDFGRVAYALPVGRDGLRVGVNASYLNYDVVADEFSALGLKGNSYTWGLDAQYPLVRSRDRNLFTTLAFDNKKYENDLSGVRNSEYRIQNFSIGLSGNSYDKFFGGGSNLANVTLTSGDLQLGALNPGESARSEGNFTRLRFLLSRQQSLTDRLSLYGALSGQLADRNLDSAEKFYLGGPNGVRAYPVSEGGGSEGTLLNVELRYRLLSNLSVTGFYDFGRVIVNRDNTPGTSPNRYNLQGAGVSFLWTGPLGLTVRGIYAHRIDDNPNPASNGRDDQDGSLIRNRFWLSISKYF